MKPVRMRPMAVVLVLLGCPLAGMAVHPDISWLNYTGAGSCASPCHVSGAWTMEAMARDFTHSSHFRLQAPVPEQSIFNRGGAAVQGQHGMLDRYCSIPGTVSTLDWLGIRQLGNPAAPEGQAAGCARCHASNGTVGPAQMNEDHWQAVDCLICHSLDYRIGGQSLTNAANRLPIADAASPTGWRLPLPIGADLGVSSLTITRHPSSQACLRCHAWADDGYRQRFTYEASAGDPHAADMTCASCHAGPGHQMQADSPSPTQWAVQHPGGMTQGLRTCATCHSTAGQAAHPELSIPLPAHGLMPANHLTVLTCQTCHITEVNGARRLAYDELERVVDNGRFIRWQRRSDGVIDQPRPPAYLWSNGTSWADDQPRGFPRQAGSSIRPFRHVTSRVPQDAATGRLLPVDDRILGEADSLMTNLVAQPNDTLALLDLAVRSGVGAAAEADPSTWGSLVDPQGDYTGAWQFLDRQMYFPVNHGARAGAGGVLSCVDCHIQGNRLDWEAMGYADGDPYFTSVGRGTLPDEFWLGPCRPNPFNNSTIVPFRLTRAGLVNLSVFDLQGRLVLPVVADQPLPAGRHEVQIAGDRLPSGVYLYRLEAEGRERTGKMLLIK